MNRIMIRRFCTRIKLIKPFVVFTLLFSILALPNAAMALLPFQKTGNLYVSMWEDDEIAVFSPDGASLERFSADGLDGPRGIAFNPFNGEIWIASEFGNAIFIFDHENRFLRNSNTRILMNLSG